MLKSAAILLAAMTLLYLPYGLASAQGPVQEALEGCSNELKTYCSAVTPGGGRLVSCAKAHEDKLSSECVYAIIRAGYWVQYFASTLQYVATQCNADALNVGLPSPRALADEWLPRGPRRSLPRA